MSPVLQLVLLSSLAQTQCSLTLPVQLVVEVVQQRSSRPPLESVHTQLMWGSIGLAITEMIMDNVDGWLQVWLCVSPLVWRICLICSRRFQHWSALSAGSLETQDPGKTGRGTGGRVRWWTIRAEGNDEEKGTFISNMQITVFQHTVSDQDIFYLTQIFLTLLSQLWHWPEIKSLYNVKRQEEVKDYSFWCTTKCLTVVRPL